MRRLFFFFLVMAASQTVLAQKQLIIHIFNPWVNDTAAERRDSLRMMGNDEVGGWYPGSDMTPEGGGWFYWTITDYQPKGWTFKLVTWIGPQVYMGRVEYSHTFNVDSMLAPFPPSTNELWIAIPDTNLPPQIYATPAKSKVINFFNPWPDNSPKIVIASSPPLRMRPRQDLWGWYQYYHVGDLEGVKAISFTDYFGLQKYTSAGLTNGPPLDLRPHFTIYDTIYIVPKPFPNGPPVIVSKFPGNIGEPPFRPMKGLFRDWKLDDISFFNNPMGMGDNLTMNMVQPTLTGPDFKPKKGPNAMLATAHGQNLETWFTTVTMTNGKPNDTIVEMMFKKSEDGQWEFDSDWIGGFFFLDSFQLPANPHNIHYSNNKGKTHNFHFTMEMHMMFAYREGKHQKFSFRGDDDVWIYLNNTLAIDLGGLHARKEDSVDLDLVKTQLGLVNGQMYKMDIFYAERNPVEANFRLKTTLDLVNSTALYYKDKLIGAGVTEYDIWQKVITMVTGLENIVSDKEELANVNFFISGPQFPKDSLIFLPPGVHFGGITVDPNKFRITIDSTKLSGLMAGTYCITFISTTDENRKGFFYFNVPPKPDHLDIDTINAPLNPNHDAILDSIFIPMDKDSVGIYAVVRDALGAFIDNATGAVWVSRDPTIVTVEALALDKSKALIIKGTKSGTTWIVVNQPGLKPDSVKVISIARPKWPIISSAIMLDDNGDVIPDLLHIALSDTFKAQQSLTAVEIDYRGKKYTVPADSCRLNGKMLFAPFTSTTGIDGRPAGTCSILMVVDSLPQSHTKIFTDGVGPALVSADVLENDGTYPDVLFLTLSEPFFTPTIAGPQLQLIKAGTTDTVILSVANVTATNDSIVVVTLSSSTSVRPQPGDKLRLVPGSKNGTVSELNLIKPHDLNRPVIIGLKIGAASIASSYYQDMDADGILDRVVVQFRRKVASSEINAIKVNWQIQNCSINPNVLITIDSATLAAPILGTVTQPDVPITGGGMHISFEFKAIPGIWRDSPVADSAAPVLAAAKLLPGSYRQSGVFEKDTLFTTFSEGVSQPGHPIPFLLSTRYLGQPYRFRLTHLTGGGHSNIFVVESVEPAAFMPSKGDTIWINQEAKVSDSLGNVQSNPKNRRVLLDIDLHNTAWIISVTENPLLPPKATVINVQPTKHVQVDQFRAFLRIYSVTGHLVLERPMAINKGSFAVAWEGRNKDGRLVGTSTYLATIKIDDGEKSVWTGRIRVGVKR